LTFVRGMRTVRWMTWCTGFVEVDDSCYVAISKNMNWLEANDACRSLHHNAYPVVVSSPAKQSAVKAVYAHLGNRLVITLPPGLARAGLLQLSLAELVEDADDDLFSEVLYNNSHVLNSLLPMANTRTYNLRQRSHNGTLVAKTSSLTERDFILRMVYKRIY